MTVVLVCLKEEVCTSSCWHTILAAVCSYLTWHHASFHPVHPPARSHCLFIDVALQPCLLYIATISLHVHRLNLPSYHAGCMHVVTDGGLHMFGTQCDGSECLRMHKRNQLCVEVSMEWYTTPLFLFFCARSTVNLVTLAHFA